MRNAELTKFLFIITFAAFSCKAPNKQDKRSDINALVKSEKSVEPEMRPPPLGSALMLTSEEGDAIPSGHADSNDSNPDLNKPLDLKLSKDLRGQNDIAPQPSMQLTASCSSSLFTNVSGGALVDIIRSQDLSCIDQMFKVKGTEAAALFNEAKMLEVAAGFIQYSQSYQGTNADGLDQLVYYLRAGYFVQFYNKTAVGNYTDVLKNAVAKGLDAFFGNSNFLSTAEPHNNVLAGVIILVDSSSLNGRFILKLLPILNRYSSVLAKTYLSEATNNIFTVYFRGHFNTDFVDLIKTNPEPLDAIINFTKNNWLIGNIKYEILLVNAINETGRFLKYEETIKAKVRPIIINFLTRFSLTSPEKKIWVTAASSAYFYDKSNCSLYHAMVCDLPKNVQNQILTVNYSCSDSLRIRSQALTEEQNKSACNLLSAQLEVFFKKVKTDASKPVMDDFNTSLEAVFFDTPPDYRIYAGISYGIATNNGGMYLEGTPSTRGNQARFIGYRASWLATFNLWNLEHEYVHYLDGRFDMPGGFGQYMKYQTIWWIEGLAEYVSKGLINPLADTQAAAGGVSFHEILKNDYDSGQDRIYRWGYLAVRYMFEKRGQDIDAILALLRSNQYDAYNTQLLAIDTKLDADFAAWLKGQDSGLVIPPLVTYTPPPPPIPVTGVGIDVSYYRIPSGVHISWAQAPVGQQYSIVVYNGATTVYNGQLGKTSADITGLSGTESLRCVIRVADTQGKSISNFPDFWIYLGSPPPSTPTFLSNPTGKTAGPVMITINYPSNSTQKLYRIGTATTWKTYTAPLTIAVNNTTINARSVKTGSNQATESKFVVSNIVIPTNIAIGKSATADSQTTTRTAAMGIDGRTATYWSSNVNQTTSHFFQVDHGSSFNFTGSEVAWRSSAAFKYTIDISEDGVNWITKIDKSKNTRATSLNKDVFSGTGRYVRITMTTSKSVAALFNEFRILGFK